MDDWKQTTIDRLARELIRLAKADQKYNFTHMEREEKQEYGTCKDYMATEGLEQALDGGLFEELERSVVNRAYELLR